MKCTVFRLGGVLGFILVFTFALSRGQSAGGSGVGGPAAEQPNQTQQKPPPSTEAATLPAAPSDPLISPDFLAPVMNPVDLAKARLNQDYQLDINDFSYTLLFQSATDTALGDRNNLNARLDLGGEWTLLHSGNDTGSIGFLFRSNENIFQNQNQSLHTNVGDVQGIDSIYGGGPAQLNLIYWRQSFMDNRLAIYIGKLHPNQHFDLSPVADDERAQFLAGVFDGNGSNPLEGAYTPGIAAEFKVTPTIEIHGIVADSLGLAQTGFTTLEEGKFYDVLQLGWNPKFNGHQGDYRIFGWHENSQTGDGSGIGVGGDQELAGGWVPFFRWGYGDPKVATIKQVVSVGIANITPFNRRSDMFGLGISWADPATHLGMREEVLIESFYRINITDHLQFSPDIELLCPPADKRNASTVAIFGARLKIIF